MQPATPSRAAGGLPLRHPSFVRERGLVVPFVASAYA
jgi:hypothetical protein